MACRSVLACSLPGGERHFKLIERILVDSPLFVLASIYLFVLLLSLLLWLRLRGQPFYQGLLPPRLQHLHLHRLILVPRGRRPPRVCVHAFVLDALLKTEYECLNSFVNPNKSTLSVHSYFCIRVFPSTLQSGGFASPFLVGSFSDFRIRKSPTCVTKNFCHLIVFWNFAHLDINWTK